MDNIGNIYDITFSLAIIPQVAVTGVALCIEERQGEEGSFLKNKRNLCERCKLK